MAYINNQYLRLDKPLEEIAKIEIKTDEKNKMISDIDIYVIIKRDNKCLGFKYGTKISLELPNIVIAYGINKKIDYCNIYSSVKILITDRETLRGKTEEIPDFIEVIIVYNDIYYDKNEKDSDKEFDLLLFENNKDIFEMKVERLIEKGKINSYNKIGNTILNYLLVNNKEEKAIKLIERMEIESINKVNKYGCTALIYACLYKMERIALKLLEREEIHDPDGACRRIDHVLHGQSLCHVNQVSKDGYTALIFACCYNMESTALKLLERKDINVNFVKYFGAGALKIAIENNMQTVVDRINELKKK
jgi:ankyrin repeat protein